MSDIIKRKSAAIASFSKIGKQNGSAPPDSKSNSLPIVYELFIADALYSVADARKKAARDAARDAGIINENYSPGDHTPFTSELLNVNVKRHNDSTTLDTTKLSVELTKRYGADVAKEIIAAASKPRKGNTIISVSAVG